MRQKKGDLLEWKGPKVKMTQMTPDMTDFVRGVWTRHDLHLFYTFRSLTTKLSKKKAMLVNFEDRLPKVALEQRPTYSFGCRKLKGQNG